MAQQVSFTCDVCGVERSHANHWFCVRLVKSRDEKSELRVFPWDGKGDMDDQVLLACGQAHVHVLLDRYFAEVS